MPSSPPSLQVTRHPCARLHTVYVQRPIYRYDPYALFQLCDHEPFTVQGRLQMVEMGPPHRRDGVCVYFHNQLLSKSAAVPPRALQNLMLITEFMATTIRRQIHFSKCLRMTITDLVCRFCDSALTSTQSVGVNSPGVFYITPL